MKSLLPVSAACILTVSSGCAQPNTAADTDSILRDLKSADLQAHERALNSIAARIDEADPTYVAPLANDPDLLRTAHALAAILSDPKQAGFSPAGQESVPQSLRQEDLTVTFAVPRLLARMGDEVVPSLVTALATSRQHFERDMNALREQHRDHVSMFGSLKGLYVETSPGVAVNPAIPVMRQFARAEVQVEAVFRERSDIHPFPLHPIAELLDSDEWTVRWSAVKLLQTAHRCSVQSNTEPPPFPVKELVAVLDDTNDVVRAEVVRSLSSTRSGVAATALADSLRTDFSLMDTIEEALVELGTNSIHALVQSQGLDDVFHRSRVAGVLARIGEPALPELLRIIREQTGAPRDMAEETIAKIGLPAVRPLVEMLRADGADVRRISAALLGRIHELEATPALIECLKDDDEKLKEEALLALRRIIGEPISYTVERRKAIAEAARQRHGFENTQWWMIKEPWQELGTDHEKWSRWWLEHRAGLLEAAVGPDKKEARRQNKAIDSDKK